MKETEKDTERRLRILRRYYEIAQARGRDNGETHEEDMIEAFRQIRDEMRDEDKRT